QPASTRRNPPRSANPPPAHGPTLAAMPAPPPHRNTSPKNASGSLRAEVESGLPDCAGSSADTHRPGQHDTKTSPETTHRMRQGSRRKTKMWGYGYSVTFPSQRKALYSRTMTTPFA